MMHFVELYHGEFSEERLLRALRNIHPERIGLFSNSVLSVEIGRAHV